MQPLAAVFLVKLPNGKVLSSVILLWGASLAVMSACTGFRSLLALRFVLGAFESFIAPTCLAVTQMWWRRGEQTLRTSFWNAMNGVTSILGSLFTYGLGHIESDRLYKYQIVRLAEVLEAVIVLREGVILILTTCDVPDLPLLWPPHRGLLAPCLPVHARLSHGGQVHVGPREGHRHGASESKPDGHRFQKVALGPRQGNGS